MTHPKTLIFDVNETLLDLAALKASVGGALGGREDLLPLWFTTMLQYSQVHTLTEDYIPFGQVGVGVLMMLAEKQGIDLARSDAEKAVLEPITQLPAHADVASGLERLSQAGFQLVSLTNSTEAGVAAQLSFAKIDHFFEFCISSEAVKAYKPAQPIYHHALEVINVDASNAMMVAAHAWDLAGAHKAGLKTAFISRPGATLYPNVARPEIVVDDLNALADALTN